jgi:hypothetical protein
MFTIVFIYLMLQKFKRTLRSKLSAMIRRETSQKTAKPEGEDEKSYRYVNCTVLSARF